MSAILAGWLVPILLGFGAHFASKRCKGRNAQKAFRFSAWGFWLLMLIHITFPLPFYLFFLNWMIIKIIPSVLLFMAAGRSVVKEMRAQQKGEFTDPAV